MCAPGGFDSESTLLRFLFVLRRSFALRVRTAGSGLRRLCAELVPHAHEDDAQHVLAPVGVVEIELHESVAAPRAESPTRSRAAPAARPGRRTTRGRWTAVARHSENCMHAATARGHGDGGSSWLFALFVAGGRLGARHFGRLATVSYSPRGESLTGATCTKISGKTLWPLCHSQLFPPGGILDWSHVHQNFAPPLFSAALFSASSLPPQTHVSLDPTCR